MAVPTPQPTRLLPPLASWPPHDAVFASLFSRVTEPSRATRALYVDDSVVSAAGAATKLWCWGLGGHQLWPPRTRRAATQRGVYPRHFGAWCWPEPEELAQLWEERARAQGLHLEASATLCVTQGSPLNIASFSDRTLSGNWFGVQSIPLTEEGDPWRPAISSWW